MKLLRLATFLFGILVLVCLTLILEPAKSSEIQSPVSPTELPQKPLNASMMESQSSLIKKIVSTGKKQLASKPAYYDLVPKSGDVETLEITKLPETGED